MMSATTPNPVQPSITLPASRRRRAKSAAKASVQATPEPAASQEHPQSDSVAPVPSGPRRSGPPASRIAPAQLPKVGGRQAQIIALLRRPEGASIEQLTAATGWQRHSVRGVISGVLKRKLGPAIDSALDEERGRVYRIRPAEPPPAVEAATPTRKRRSKTQRGS